MKHQKKHKKKHEQISLNKQQGTISVSAKGTGTVTNSLMAIDAILAVRP